MKSHYCTVEQAYISFENECNWCGKKESETANVHTVLTRWEPTDKEIVDMWFKYLEDATPVRSFTRAVIRKARGE